LPGSNVLGWALTHLATVHQSSVPKRPRLSDTRQVRFAQHSERIRRHTASANPSSTRPTRLDTFDVSQSRVADLWLRLHTRFSKRASRRAALLIFCAETSGCTHP
jgi:hypothetical protein